MKDREKTFPEPSCRQECPHFKSVGTLLNETCYCMKKSKKGKRFGKRDLKREPPAWCPRRLAKPRCRIYGFKDEFQEYMDRETRQQFDPEGNPYYFPMASRYQLTCEFPLGMTAPSFYREAKEKYIGGILDGHLAGDGEIVEIDDGLRPYFFYVYNRAKVLPAIVVGQLAGSE